ncbi:MAG: hypothetical protein ABEJ56_05540 [Candidatus Nanohaloarchaea archaeon]
MVDGDGPLPDGKWEIGFVVVAGVAVFAGSMMYVQENPGAPWQFEALYSSTVGELSAASTASEDGLVLSQNDAKYLNRIYTELNTGSGDRVGETGFCIDKIGDRISVQKAGTLKSSESSTTFTTANCVGTVDGTLHFHPPSSEAVLSGPETSVSEQFNDKRSFLESSFELSCVMAAPIQKDKGSSLSNLRCFQKPADANIGSVFPEVEVNVAR